MDDPSADDDSRADRVTCPTCGAGVPVSLPRSAANLAVTATPDDELDAEEDADPRTRRLSYSCAADHSVYVYFDW